MVQARVSELTDSHPSEDSTGPTYSMQLVEKVVNNFSQPLKRHKFELNGLLNILIYNPQIYSNKRKF